MDKEKGITDNDKDMIETAYKLWCILALIYYKRKHHL